MSKAFRIAVLTTEFSPRSHADVIVSRWVHPRPTDPKYGWSRPATQIASLYVDQFPEADLSRALSADAGIPLFGTIEEALTLGGEDLAVDAVMLIAEHGTYPLNARGQKLYPRKAMFDQIIRVFQKSGRVVPLFLDKHLSWNPGWAHEMYWTIRDMKIPFFGGSSISLSPFRPEPISGSGLEEIVAIYFNEVESYLFHSLEVVEAVVDPAPRGRQGIVSVTAWQGARAWQALEDGAFSAELLERAAAVVSDEALAAWQNFRRERGEPFYAFQIQYADGLKATHVMQFDRIRKWSVAGRESGTGRVIAAHVDPGTREEFHPSFARFNRLIEDFFLSGKSPVDLDRTYLTTMATAACMQALAQEGTPVEPHWLRLPAERSFAMSAETCP